MKKYLAVLILIVLSIVVAVPAMAGVKKASIPGAWVNARCITGEAWTKVRVLGYPNVPKAIIYHPDMDMIVGECIGPYSTTQRPDSTQ